MAKYDYDLIVLGGGSAGLTASKMAKGFGKKVALIEKNKLGGECTWTGCVPSKALIKIASLIKNQKTLVQNGLLANDSAINETAVMNLVREKIGAVYATHTPEQFAKTGVDLFFGSPRFVDRHTVMLNEKEITAKSFIIATGSSPFIPPIEGIESVNYLTNQTFFDLETVPSSISILGGGPIGVELSSALQTLGVQVTIIEMNRNILSHEDEELAMLLQENMKQKGIVIKTNTRAVGFKQLADGAVQLLCESTDEEYKSEPFNITSQVCLIATGRKPNIDGLGLESIGVETTKRGIIVDKRLQTSVKNIYACGDVIGSYQFSHVAWQQAVTATRNALIPLFKKKIDYSNIVWTTFSDPEFATAGLTEKKAREQYGDNIKLYTVDYKDIDRAVIDGETFGRGKFVCDKKGWLLGAHILGNRAGELIHELLLAKSKGIKLSALGSMLHAYPTYSDLIWKAAKKARIDKIQNSFFVRLYKKLFGKG